MKSETKKAASIDPAFFHTMVKTMVIKSYETGFYF